MTFPADVVPDGHIFAPHHAYIGVLVATVALLVIWDDRTADPWLALAALLGLLFSFALVWPFYPQTGAALSLAAVSVALVAPLLRLGYWRGVDVVDVVVFVIGVLVATDDVVEHALGLPTPLDWLWVHHIHQFIS